MGLRMRSKLAYLLFRYMLEIYFCVHFHSRCGLLNCSNHFGTCCIFDMRKISLNVVWQFRFSPILTHKKYFTEVLTLSFTPQVVSKVFYHFVSRFNKLLFMRLRILYTALQFILLPSPFLLLAVGPALHFQSLLVIYLHILLVFTDLQ
jgi:hypothetical protein